MIETKTVSIGRVVNSFPKLMTTVNGTIVLFTEEGCGAVVHANPGYGKVPKLGAYREDFAMGQFSDYYGSVTIQNVLGGAE